MLKTGLKTGVLLTPSLWLEVWGAPKSWGPKGGAPNGRGPKFHAFFLSRSNFLSFIPLFGGLLVEFWWRFEAPGPSNVRVWSSRAVV